MRPHVRLRYKYVRYWHSMTAIKSKLLQCFSFIRTPGPACRFLPLHDPPRHRKSRNAARYHQTNSPPHFNSFFFNLWSHGKIPLCPLSPLLYVCDDAEGMTTAVALATIEQILKTNTSTFQCTQSIYVIFFSYPLFLKKTNSRFIVSEQEKWWECRRT